MKVIEGFFYHLGVSEELDGQASGSFTPGGFEPPTTSLGDSRVSVFPSRNVENWKFS